MFRSCLFDATFQYRICQFGIQCVSAFSFVLQMSSHIMYYVSHRILQNAVISCCMSLALLQCMNRVPRCLAGRAEGPSADEVAWQSAVPFDIRQKMSYVI